MKTSDSSDMSDPFMTKFHSSVLLIHFTQERFDSFVSNAAPRIL